MRLEDCDAQFSLIEGTNDRKRLSKAFKKLLADYPQISLGLVRGSVFWRAQHSDDTGHPLATRMTYPPPSYAKAGRLNDQGSPCLYLAASPETALAEIGAKEGEHVHLVGFRILADRQIRAVAIGELAHVQKAGYLRVAGRDPDRSIARVLNAYPHDRALRILYVDSFLGSVLADPNAQTKEYIPSRTLASMIYRKTSASGMFYPSVRSTLGMNLAIRPTIADRSMHMVASIVVRVTKVLRFGYIDYDVLRTAKGIDDEERFQWLAPQYSKHIIVFNLTKEEFEAGQGERRTLLDLPAHRTTPIDDAGPIRRFIRRLVQ